MAVSTTNLKAAAAFDLRPAKSQVVLVSLIVASIFSLFIGGGLLGFEKNSGWAFVAIAVILFTAVVWCWLQSQRDTDVAPSQQTKLTLADGTNISTDTRIFSSPEAVRNLAQTVDALAFRRPLPEATGVTTAGNLPVPNSSKEAARIVDEVNSKAQRVHDEVVALLKGPGSKDTVVQDPNYDRVLPPDAIPGAIGLNSIAGSTP